jgi:hypothetical protein
MRRRSAFTLVELLVSMALIIFIMAILAEAFVEGLKTFRNMKAVGDMNARLRTAEQMMRDDLSADHFEGKRRLSEPYFWTIGPPREGFFRLWHGSLIATPGPGAFYNEGTVDGVPSYYAIDHVLQFTAKKRGNNRQDFYSAAVPSNSPLLALGQPDSRYQETAGGVTSYNSQWAEIAWFLRPNGKNAGSQPLFTLYRRQRVVVPSTMLMNAGNLVDLNYQAPGALPLTAKPDYLEVSTSQSYSGPSHPATLYFNSPRDLTIPERRFGMNPSVSAGLPVRTDNNLRYPIIALGPKPPFNYQSPNYQADDEDCTAALVPPGHPEASREGSDVILTDVISFAVIPIFSGVPVENFPPQNKSFPKDAGGNPTVSVFDTWSNHADDTYDYTLWDNADFGGALTDAHLVPCKLVQISPTQAGPAVLTGLQISIRVWDARTTQTRQITIMQDL